MNVTCKRCGAVHRIAPPPWVVSAGRPFRMTCADCGAGQDVVPTGLMILDDPPASRLGDPEEDEAGERSPVPVFAMPASGAAEDAPVLEMPLPPPRPVMRRPSFAVPPPLASTPPEPLPMPPPTWNAVRDVAEEEEPYVARDTPSPNREPDPEPDPFAGLAPREPTRGRSRLAPVVADDEPALPPLPVGRPRLADPVGPELIPQPPPDDDWRLAAGDVWSEADEAISRGTSATMVPFDPASFVGSFGGEDAPARTNTAPDESAPRFLVRRNGERFPVPDLAALQRWVVEGKLARTDDLSENGGPWRPAGELEDLLVFFDAVERAAAVAGAVPASAPRPVAAGEPPARRTPEPAGRVPVPAPTLPPEEDEDTEQSVPLARPPVPRYGVDEFEAATVPMFVPPNRVPEATATRPEPSSSPGLRVSWRRVVLALAALAALGSALGYQFGGRAGGSAGARSAPPVVGAATEAPTVVSESAAVVTEPAVPETPAPRPAKAVPAVRTAAVLPAQPPATPKAAASPPPEVAEEAPADPPIRPRIEPRVVPETPTEASGGTEAPEPVSPPAPPRVERRRVPDDAGYAALVDFGWEALDADDVATAVEAFQRAVALEPDGVGANYGYGYALLTRGRVTQARAPLCRAFARAEGRDLAELERLIAQHGIACDGP